MMRRVWPAVIDHTKHVAGPAHIAPHATGCAAAARALCVIAHPWHATRAAATHAADAAAKNCDAEGLACGEALDDRLPSHTFSMVDERHP